MRSEIGFARTVEHAFAFVLADRLERVAQTWLNVAVVEKQACAAMFRDTLGDGLHQDLARRRDLEDAAVGRILRVCRKGIRCERCRADAELESAVGVDPDGAFQPFAVLPDELPEGQGVEDLVPDDEQRPVRQGVEGGVPGERGSALLQSLMLDGCQARAYFDESKVGFDGEFGRNPANGADYIL